MNNTFKTTVFGAVAMAGLLAASPAKADRVSFGLSLGEAGNFFALGINSGGRGPCGPSHRPPSCAPARGGMAFPAPAPVVMAPPVVVAPPPVVVASAPVVVAPAGYWQEREERVWVDGCWFETVDAFGRRCKQWQPGRWEIRRTREWISY